MFSWDPRCGLKGLWGGLFPIALPRTSAAVFSQAPQAGQRPAMSWGQLLVCSLPSLMRPSVSNVAHAL